jgi:dihydropteroate synthase
LSATERPARQLCLAARLRYLFRMPATWTVRGRILSLQRPLVMGIVNVTPDSFSDGGLFSDPHAAEAHAALLFAEGADIIDVGGESTRPTARVIGADEEMRRVLPLIRAIARDQPTTIISVDTTKSVVAEAAIDAGAHVVNDVSAMRLDPAMAAVCATHGVGVVLMHSRGGVENMASFAHATYDGDPVDAMIAELGERVAWALERGIARQSIAVDPGVGFSKRSSDSLRVLACLERLVAWDYPVLVGVSRKRFIGELTGTAEPARRVFGSVGAAVAAYDRGARIFRVHDAAAARHALDVAAAIGDAMGDARGE